MNIIDEIKGRLDIVALAGEHLQLQRSGKNWKARCPFHNDQNPSLVVFPASQRWACFGSGCNQAGDLIDLVQRVKKWDFPSTLRYLAERAGVELQPLSEGQRLQQQARQARELVFGTAMTFFQQHLFRPAAHHTPELAYAVGRGWSKDTLLEAGIGSLGQDREGLRRCLVQAGIDIEQPAAVALLGRRARAREWAEKYQVQLPQSWLEQDWIPGMPYNMLIYPHLERGRVVYLAGRHISAKGHWNPPRELAGPRQPYFNSNWWRTDLPEALIVEGQGDALTLAQWGIPAVALAGCSLSGPQTSLSETNQPEAGESELLRMLLQRGKGGRVAVALDADEAGEKGNLQVAGALCQAGLQAHRVGLVRWPKTDANQWLQAGASAAEAWELLRGSGTWLDELICQAAGHSQDESALQRVFEALAELNAYELVAYKNKLCQKLKLSRNTFEGLLKTARVERTHRRVAGKREGLGEDGILSFGVVDGCICRRSYNAQGQETLDRLSNFCARIEKEVRRDDGQQIELEFHIGGEVKGKRLPLASVLAEEYERMEWVVREWGSAAIIEPGMGRRDQLRAAILYLSEGCQKERVFTHTGWRELEPGQRVYLSGSGALGYEGVEVELDSDLRRYRLPDSPANPVEAMQESLEFIHLAPFEISTPLWGAIWLAPLSELVRPNFVVWLFGRTGTLKSSLAALALNHYGAEFDGFQFPANFSDTPGRLEHKAFLAKDALLVIDDYAPQRNPRDAVEYKRAANHIIRAVGNQAGRGRLTKEIKARLSYAPRGVVVATGEELPDTESLVARLFVVEFKAGSVNKERLAAMQKKMQIYAHALAGYLAWVGEHWNAYKDLLPQRWEHYRRLATSEGVHLRMPETAASLMMGWEMGLRYALSIDALRSDDYQQLLELGWSALMAICLEMKQRTCEERPEELFLTTLRELLAQGKIHLRQRGGSKFLGGPEERAEMLGWYDEAHLYLLPEAVYARIARHFREQGGLFPVRQTTLRKGLKEAGWLVHKPGRTTSTEWLDGRVHRVVVMRRQVLEDLAPDDYCKGDP